MITTTNLGKTFWPIPRWLTLGGRGSSRPVRALSDVTLEVASGQVFGLLGPNGAGKTTLLKVLATLVRPSEGQAKVNGADVVHDDREVRRLVGLATGDERGFYWRLTGRENLEFFAGLRGLGPRAARRRSDAVLEIIGLGSAAGELVARYSTGMRQRLAIARALLGDPPVLLLDEPTRSLDPEAADQTRALLRAMAQEGRTIMISTHGLAEAAGLCDRVAILIGGRVRDLMSVTRNEEDLRMAYRNALNDAESASHPRVS